MNSWKCCQCKNENACNEKNGRCCNAGCCRKEENHKDGEKKRHERVYTSGPISNSIVGRTQVAQELWLCVTNFSNHPITVKAEVLNWGDPAVSAGLSAFSSGMTALPMNAITVAVMPSATIEVPGFRTQYFFSDLLTGGPLATEVLSFEIRVTVTSSDPHAKVVFNAVAYSAAETPESELEGFFDLEEADMEEVFEAAAPFTTISVLFKDFVLVKNKIK